jgi:pyrroline-5-carboxylate reductase
MSTKSIGFIGSGRIATIFTGGWARAGAMPDKVVIFDCNQDVMAKLKSQHPDIRVGTLTEAVGQDIVFLAVHPPVIGGLLPQVKPALKPDAVMVSLAPKFAIAKLTEMLGGFRRIARMIPNAPSIVGKGYNPTAFGEALGDPERVTLRKLFGGLGECVEVPEAHLEVYAIVSAMGLTFLWPQLDMLASLAETSGLSRQAAWDGIEKMLLGAVAAMRDSGLPAAGVQDLVPVKPVADEVSAFVAAARPKLDGLLTKLRP